VGEFEGVVGDLEVLLQSHCGAGQLLVVDIDVIVQPGRVVDKHQFTVTLEGDRQVLMFQQKGLTIRILQSIKRLKNNQEDSLKRLLT